GWGGEGAQGAQAGVAAGQGLGGGGEEGGAALADEVLVEGDEGAGAVVVGGEARGGVPVAGEGGGEPVGADEGEAGALAGEERGRVGGVAQQGGPAAGPAGHADLADGVEEHVVRVVEGGEDLRDPPARVGEDLGEEGLSGSLVAEHVAGRLGPGEVEEGVHLVAVADGVEGDGPAGG